MTNARPVVRLAGVSKAFHQRPVLCNVDLAVHPGEIVAIIGHNGSGKTTLLRIVATTVLPDAGEVEIAGVDAVRHSLLARRHVGVALADERAWYWRLSGRTNLEFFAALHGLSRREAAERSTELIESVGLTAAADQPFGEYSSGMRLRLSFARALLGEPRLLLLDEPTRSIDPPGAASFRQMIRRYVHETGTAALLASHDLAEVNELAGCAFLLEAGLEPQHIEPPLSPDRLGHALQEAR